MNAIATLSGPSDVFVKWLPMHFLNFELCIISRTVIFIFRSGNSWLYYTLGPLAFRWLSPPRLALLSWISVKRLSYGPPKDVTQEGKSGFSAQFVLLPSDCRKLLPQMKFCLHRLLQGRGRSDVLSRAGQLSQPLRVGWHPLRLAGMLLYILFQMFWPTIVPDVLPHVRVCSGLLQSFLDAQHILGSSLARDPEETAALAQVLSTAVPFWKMPSCLFSCQRSPPSMFCEHLVLSKLV